MKHISQRKAAAYRKRVVELEKEITNLRYDKDAVVKRVPLTRWDGIGSNVLAEIKTVQKLGFRVEATAEGTCMIFSAVRRKGDA